MSGFVRDWGSLIATLVLVLVTAWYVAVTKRIAESSKDSAHSAGEAAEAARIAAEASRATADAALAGVRVEFDISPLYCYRKTDTDRFEMELEVLLRGGGSTVFVHGLVLDYVGLPSGTPEEGRWFVTAGVHDLELVAKQELPVRLHRFEELQFHLPEEQRLLLQQEVGQLECRVRYSLNGIGPILPRRATWSEDL